MSEPPATPESGERENQRESFFTFYPQFFTGLLLGTAVIGMIAAVAVKYPTEGGLVVWSGVFAVAWLCVFFILRRGWNGVLFGFFIGLAIAYYVITQIFHMGAFS